jgi:DNA primase
MRYSPSVLDEILRRVDLVQLVGRKVKLTRRGQAFWGCCPFHKEKSPSFKVENARRSYKCFGCGAGGDAFKWLEQTEGLTFPEAVEKLAAEAGVDLPKSAPEDEAREQKRKLLIDVVAAAADFFAAQLSAPAGAPAREYLKGRGLGPEDVRRFRLGYAPANSGLLHHLLLQNVPEADIVAAGLARPADENHGVRDFFFNRLMFPIADGRGRVVAFGGRGLTPDAKPKYINTGETALFQKGQMLYNFAEARKAAIREQRIILCEGYMDVIALVMAGFEAAVAPLGTALTEEQLQLLWRTAAEPTITFDGDEAGLKAAKRAAHLALPGLKPGCSLRFAFLPPDEDPDSLIRSQGPAAMKAVLDGAEPLVQVLWRGQTEGRDFSTPEARAGLEKTLAEIVAAIGEPKVADYYKRDFEDRVFNAFKRRRRATKAGQPRFDPSALAPQRGYDGPRRGRGVPFQPFVAASEALKTSSLARAAPAAARKAKEDEICRYLLEDRSLIESHAETLAELPFSDPLLDRFRQELLNLAASEKGLEEDALSDHLVRMGMGEVLARLRSRNAARVQTQPALDPEASDIEARFLVASRQLREMDRSGPVSAEAVKSLLAVRRRNAP